jgi:hypothetical protein
MISMKVIYNLIVRERRRQDELWGAIQTHSPSVWQLILGEEKGEADKAALECNREDYINELIHTVAVGMAILEHVLDEDDPINEHFCQWIEEEK